jgi:hypothetical protein
VKSITGKGQEKENTDQKQNATETIQKANKTLDPWIDLVLSQIPFDSRNQPKHKHNRV